MRTLRIMLSLLKHYYACAAPEDSSSSDDEPVPAAETATAASSAAKSLAAEASTCAHQGTTSKDLVTDRKGQTQKETVSLEIAFQLESQLAMEAMQDAQGTLEHLAEQMLNEMPEDERDVCERLETALQQLLSAAKAVYNVAEAAARGDADEAAVQTAKYEQQLESNATKQLLQELADTKNMTLTSVDFQAVSACISRSSSASETSTASSAPGSQGETSRNATDSPGGDARLMRHTSKSSASAPAAAFTVLHGSSAVHCHCAVPGVGHDALACFVKYYCSPRHKSCCQCC